MVGRATTASISTTVKSRRLNSDMFLLAAFDALTGAAREFEKAIFRASSLGLCLPKYVVRLRLVFLGRAGVVRRSDWTYESPRGRGNSFGSPNRGRLSDEAIRVAVALRP